VGLVCALAAGLAVGVRGEATEEIGRLAGLIGWKAGTVAADIGAGDGKYTLRPAERVGAAGRVYATEIDAKKLEELKNPGGETEARECAGAGEQRADTKSAGGSCDAIFLRHVYHHLTKPAEFDASLVRSLKPGGRLAIIDFPARAGLDPVEGVPSNRGGHGIPQKIVIES